jgi:nitrite reductase/ring-hydroxylating ferredoxin subunit
MPEPDVDAPTGATPRRAVLKSAAVLGVAVPFLAACGSNNGSGSSAGSTSGTPDASSGGQTSSAGGGNGGRPGNTGGGGGGADVIAATKDVPDGGGVILDNPAIVITQPSSGEFKGFSPICTHQGCTVASVSDGTINCPCHGSQFSIADGGVVGGPAPAPLPQIKISVHGSDISLA